MKRLSIIFLLFACKVFAVDNYWSALVTGDYNTALNWSLVSVPDSTVNAFFTNIVNETVTITANAACSNANFNQISGALDMSIAGGNAWTMTKNFTVANAAGQNSVLLLTNSGSLIATNGATTIGNSGVGIVTQSMGLVFVTNMLVSSLAGSGGTYYLSGGTNSSIGGLTIGSANGSTGSYYAVGGSLFLNGSLTVGSSGKGSLLVVSNASTVTNKTFIIGSLAGANNNNALITGSGTLVSCGAQCSIGSVGQTNTLIVDNNAIVTNTLGFVVGQTSKANLLIISNGGKVYGAGSAIGNGAANSNNTVIVTGSGSLWQTSSLTIDGLSETLIITNSGTVSCTSTLANGNAASSFSNLVIVSGATLTMTNNVIQNGGVGSSNTFLVNNGGIVRASAVNVGNNAGSFRDLMSVYDPGSLVTNSAIFTIGHVGNENTLVISNSGTVWASSLHISKLTPSATNHLVIDGGNLITSGAVNSGTNVTTKGFGMILLENSAAVTCSAFNNSLQSILTVSNAGNSIQGTLVNGGQTVIVGQLTLK